MTSTSVVIAWNEISQDDANGVITNYSVCYKVSQNLSEVDCTSSKTVDASTTTFNLTGLNEATTYVVAVRAKTSKGFGKLGMAVNITTLEDSKFVFILLKN